MKKIYLSLLSLLLCTLTFAQVQLQQSIFIDFGKNDVTNGNITQSPDTYGHYWNNAFEPELGKRLSLVSSTNVSTGFELEITRKFSANGILNGGLLTPDPSLLGDFAINTATQDYFFVDAGSNYGSFKIKNLNKNKAYKFHVFGSRLDNSNERIGYISFTGANGSHGLHKMGGPGIGANGVNQNNNTIYESDWVFPDIKGEILFQLAFKSGNFAHINIMKIEEYTGVEPLKVEQKYYIDFGRENGTDGSITQGGDDLVNTWNNVSGGFDIAKQKKVSLSNSSGTATPVELELLSNFRANGRNNGALLNPDPALLGDLAITHATEDYLFIESGSGADPGKIGFYNLNPHRTYRFHVFGSRYDTNDRIAILTFTGKNSSMGPHRMAGTGMGVNTSNANEKNQNNSYIYVSDPVTPDASGQIILDIVRYASTYSHINAMKIEECSDETIIRPVSIKLTCPDITEPGESVQITATVLPEGATYNAIKWEIDDKTVANLSNKGFLSPKKNGIVNVKASIELEDKTLSDEIQIHISGQLGAVSLSGTASEDANPLEMRMITNLDGMLTNNFEIYTSLKQGTFTLSRDLGNGNTAQYGAGATAGTLEENGEPIQAEVNGPVRISVNLTDMTYIVLPITSLNIVGNSAPGGSDVSKGSSLTYQGNAVWTASLILNSGDPSFYFVINKSSQEILKRIIGTNGVMQQSQATQFGISTENVRTNMNGGAYEVSIDLRNYTYSVSCGEVQDLKISYMGSSVASGTGAQSNFGWAYMYTNLLKQRYADGQGLNWTTSNISIGGNTTTNLLDRWERDLLSNCSSYVIYGLSLGNEGIHEKGEPAYTSYHDGMLKAIKQARDAGIVPIMANNYTRADFNATDYNYVKKLNLLIHEWDVPSINTLGAIDNGAGKWATGYEADNAHPNTAGHVEFYYAMVPSLFDALEAGKPLPTRVSGTSYKLGRNITADRIEFTPENIVHPFTVSFDIKATTAGTIAWFENETGHGFLKINSEGKVVYESPKKGSITSATSVMTGEWKRVTLTHYYAWGITVLYINDVKAGELSERLAPKTFALGGTEAPVEVDYRELFFWRAGMTAEEIQYVNNGKMMKSSLEIYAPLGGTEPMVNLAQSTNTLKLANSSQNLDRKMFFDFGPTNNLGAITSSPDKNGNYWNNITGNTTNFNLDLVSSMNEATGYNLEITKDFSMNPGGQGGLSTPDAELLGDLAIGTATQDYLFAEGKNATFKIKNLDPEKTYKFYVFGSRLGTTDDDSRKSQYTFTGTNTSQGIIQTTGLGKVQNTNNLFTSGLLIPNASGEINFELVNTESNFGYINAMKMEEYSAVDIEDVSPLISVTPAEGLGVRIARIYSSTGGNANETAENLLLDKRVAANVTKKWCYNASAHAVVIELSDYYDVDKFVIDDCKTHENNSNFPEYYIYVSTTGTADGDWTEVVHEVNQSDVICKISKIIPSKARYIKFVPKGIDMIRIFSFQIYGRKSFDSVHAKELISVGKPVIDQQTSPDIQQAAVALFDANKNAANGKWSTSTGNKYVVVDLKDSHSISEFKLYDAQSVNTTNQNIDGYKISISGDLSGWETVVDVTGKSSENIKTDILGIVKDARYVKLEIPEARMGSEKKVNLYEFEIYGKLLTTQADADLTMLKTTGGTLTPGFDPSRTNYTLTVPKEVDKIMIQALARNESAIPSGDLGEKALQLGENRFSVTVTAADQVTRKTYYLTITRTKKSDLAELKSLTIDGIDLVPAFISSNASYRAAVNASSVNIVAVVNTPYAIITGTGQHTLSDGANYLKVTVDSEDGSKHLEYDLTVYNTKNLVSVSSGDGKGKRIVNVDSYSGMASVNENPFRLLRGWKENLSGDTQMKWCDNTPGQPWVIFSLTDIYTINRIEFRDCKMVEKDRPNVPQYSVYVSTTDTTEECWIQIINESGLSEINEKVKSFDPVDARFVKFVPAKADNAVRIYGFDIYGTFKEKIDRGGNIAAGKTIAAYSVCTGEMFTPANLLDGRSGSFWEFNRAGVYVVVDLEEPARINKFVVVDSPTWITGYKISVSDTGNGTDWKEVANPEFSEMTLERKEVTLLTPELTRYIRLDIPRANQAVSGIGHIKEFEIYQWSGSGIEQPESLSAGKFMLYPNPVVRGEKIALSETGLVKIYSVQGQLIHEQDIRKNESISTRNLDPGSYVVCLINDQGSKQAKLVVK